MLLHINVVNLNITIEMVTILEKIANISPDTLIAKIKLLKKSSDKNIPKRINNEFVFVA